MKALQLTDIAVAPDLHELTKHAPVAIIADALGYAPTTIAHHATASSAGYAQYIATIRATQGTEPTP